MITVTQAAEKIINRSRYLTEAISKDLINISSLARYIQPEIEQLLLRKVSRPSIIMSLNRLSKKVQPSHKYQRLFNDTPDITVRSPMTALYIADSHYSAINSFISRHNPASYYLVKSHDSSFLLAPVESMNIVKEEFPEILESPELLATLTVTLPKSALDTPGAFYFFLKSLTWENINIVELFTNREKFIIVVREKDVDQAYGVIRSLFSENRIEW